MLNFVENASTYLTIAAALIILIVFLIALNGVKNRTSLAKDATSILTSIGILFTFVGISIALFNFDPQNINDSIPQLLGGLKVAFLSSVGGLGAGLVFKIIKPSLERKTDTGVSDVGAEDLYTALKNIDETIREGNKNIKDALTGEGDSSLSTQFGKLRNDFRDFADKVSEDGSQKLIEALQEVIKDFNQKISEQFGENFKKLNEAVGALLVWQKEHKDHIEKLTEAYEKTTTGIEDINKSFKDIQVSTEKIPDSMQSIEKVFDSTNERITEMYSGLKSLSDMRQKAEESLPFIQEQITSMTDGLKESVDTQINTMQKNMLSMKESDDEMKIFIKDMNEEVKKSHEMIHNQIDNSVKEFSNQTNELFSNNYKEQENYALKQNERFEGLANTLTMSADNIYEQTKKSSADLEGAVNAVSDNFKSLIGQFGEAQKEYNNDMKANLDGQVNDTQEALNAAIQEVNNKMNDQLNSSLKVLGNNLESISQGLSDGYQKSTEQINKAIKEISVNRN